MIDLTQTILHSRERVKKKMKLMKEILGSELLRYTGPGDFENSIRKGINLFKGNSNSLE